MGRNGADERAAKRFLLTASPAAEAIPTCTVGERRLIFFSHAGDGMHLLAAHPGSILVTVLRAPTEDPNFERMSPPSRFMGLTSEAFGPAE